MRLQVNDGLIRQPLGKLQLFDCRGDLLIAVLPQRELGSYKISQLLKIHLKLRRQQESKTEQQAETPHIYYHDVAWTAKVALIKPAYAAGAEELASITARKILLIRVE